MISLASNAAATLTRVARDLRPPKPRSIIEITSCEMRAAAARSAWRQPRRRRRARMTTPKRTRSTPETIADHAYRRLTLAAPEAQLGQTTGERTSEDQQRWQR